MRFDKQFLTRTLSHVSISQDFFPEDVLFSIDTRTIQPGEIFVALVGQRVDGHHFVKEAFEKGAAGCIIEESKKTLLHTIPKNVLGEKLIIEVTNTYEALIALAKAWRTQFSYPVVGITGSVGKTSSKELLCHVLELYGMRYIASVDNQNTLLASALTILRMREYHQVAIFEMGISHRGEMSLLADLIMPNIAGITYIGHQHMAGLGSLEDISAQKRQIFKNFAEHNIGIINGDQSILSDVSYLHPVIKFGSKMSNQIQARKVRIASGQIQFVLKIYGKKYPVLIKKSHAGVITQSLVVAAISHLLEIPDDIIVEAIQTPVTVAGRFQQLPCKFGGVTLINDCYNANPESVKAALLAFQQIESSHQKIAVLGDMLGLGVNSPFWHRQIGRFLRKVTSVKRVILVGELVKSIKQTAPFGVTVSVVSDWQSAASLLEEEIKKNPAMVLVKGSHDIGLNNLVEQFI